MTKITFFTQILSKLVEFFVGHFNSSQLSLKYKETDKVIQSNESFNSCKWLYDNTKKLKF